MKKIIIKIFEDARGRLSKKEFAIKYLKITPASYQHLINGRIVPQLHHFLNLRKLGISIDNLLDKIIKRK